LNVPATSDGSEASAFSANSGGRITGLSVANFEVF
jgi:hypothetical protein